MRKDQTPERLAIDISERSSCSVRVGAVVADRKGRIIVWGWNSVGDGYGSCAEHHAIMRANPKRLHGSRIFIAGFRASSMNPVTSKPCKQCQKIIKRSGLSQATYLTKEHEWERLYD